MSDGRGERREIRVEEMRERREIRMVEEVPTRDRREPRAENQRSSGSHKHMVYQEMEIVDPARISASREKRHKRSHKHERTRDREREREKELGINSHCFLILKLLNSFIEKLTEPSKI